MTNDEAYIFKTHTKSGVLPTRQQFAPVPFVALIEIAIMCLWDQLSLHSERLMFLLTDIFDAQRGLIYFFGDTFRPSEKIMG